MPTRPVTKALSRVLRKCWRNLLWKCDVGEAKLLYTNVDDNESSGFC